MKFEMPEIKYINMTENIIQQMKDDIKEWK